MMAPEDWGFLIYFGMPFGLGLLIGAIAGACMALVGFA